MVIRNDVGDLFQHVEFKGGGRNRMAFFYLTEGKEDIWVFTSKFMEM